MSKHWANIGELDFEAGDRIDIWIAATHASREHVSVARQWGRAELEECLEPGFAVSEQTRAESAMATANAATRSSNQEISAEDHQRENNPRSLICARESTGLCTQPGTVYLSKSERFA